MSFIKTLKMIIKTTKFNLIYTFFIKYSNRYFLCRPRGGLNDTLNQIEKSCKYCIKWKRKLFVDTYRSGLRDNLSNYFIFPKYISFNKIDFITYPASVYPIDLQNDINNYEAKLGKDGYEIINGTSLNIDFKKDYKEQYIVYDNCGGGVRSIDLLYRIKLKKYLRKRIIKNKNILGKYTAVHIRNTDIKTDYKDFLNSIKKKLKYNRILVCTDSYEVLQYSKDLFKEQLYIFSNIPDTNGFSLHDNPTLNNKSITTDAIIDLFLLALSNELYITKLTNNSLTNNSYSGYSQLAMSLHKNKFLLYKLIYF